MSSKKQKTVAFAILALALGEFVLDLNISSGAAVWIGYFILLLSTVFAGGQYLQYLLAGIFSVMMLVNILFSRR